MNRTLLIVLLFLTSCGYARVERPDGTIRTCYAFGQAHVMACTDAGTMHTDSTSSAFLMGDCCDVHGGPVSTQTNSTMLNIVTAAFSALVALASFGLL